MFHPEPPAGALLPSTPRLPVRTHAPIISVFEVQVNKLTLWLGIVDLFVNIRIMGGMTYEIELNAARKAYIHLVLHTELDRDECLAELLKNFSQDAAEEAIADVESELDELN